MEYLTSTQEINRRKKAFLSLLAFSFFGLFLFSRLLNYPIPGQSYLWLALAFLPILIISFSFLSRLTKTKLYLDKDKVTINNGKSERSLAFTEIKNIKIKRRNTGGIREIYLRGKKRESLILTAQEENFADIRNFLVSQIGATVKFKEFKELLNFDHLFFYPALGLGLAFFGLVFFQLLITLNQVALKIILFSFSGLSFGLAGYCIFRKPMAARGEKKGDWIDYGLGLLIGGAGFLGLIIGLNS